MKAAIVNPYLDTLGGGERYTLSFAKVLLKLGYEVDIEWKMDLKTGEGGDVSTFPKKIQYPLSLELFKKRFGIDLKGARFVESVKRGDGYDVCFWVSDGSVPTLLARRNFLHFQIPFTNVGGNTLINKIKFFRINKVICNSEFTKSFIDREYKVNSIVVYPPVDVEAFHAGRKKNVILSVGRFSQLKQAKRHDVLIASFRRLCHRGIRNWKLIIAGGAEVGSDGYLDKLRRKSIGYPIEFYISPDFGVLKRLYATSKIFWSASGYGVDSLREPEKLEHFGITTVEAMAAGCIPIVYGAGGAGEIIQNEVDGYLWHNSSELIKITRKIINDRKIQEKVSFGAIQKSKRFSVERFEEKVTELLEK